MLYLLLFRESREVRRMRKDLERGTFLGAVERKMGPRLAGRSGL